MGIAKVFVGELIECAREIASTQGRENVALLPSDIREAYRNLKERGLVEGEKIPHSMRILRR